MFAGKTLDMPLAGLRLKLQEPDCIYFRTNFVYILLLLGKDTLHRYGGEGWHRVSVGGPFELARHVTGKRKLFMHSIIHQGTF